MIRSFILLSLCLAFLSCAKDRTPSETDADETEDSDTTEMAKGLLFSSVMLNDFLQAEDDEDLGMYLENEIYPLISQHKGIQIERSGAGSYLLSYDSSGTQKELRIERFYDAKNEETYFTLDTLKEE